MKSRKKTSLVWTTPKEEMQELLDNSSSIVGILKKLGFDGYNGNHRTLKQRIFSGEFDLTQFEENKKEESSNRAFRLRFSNKISEQDIFKENSSYQRTSLKQLLIKDCGFEYKCAECGILDSYNKKPISLQLDHINGINNDNRIENLRFLCPNCHSQTDSFSGKRHKKHYSCSCGNKKSKSANRCQSCDLKDKPKKQNVIWPNVEEVARLVWELPTTIIAKNIGVSDVAINKFCKKHQILKPSRGFWSKRKNKPPET
jgi:5-methylcytosine-specific restriction endonuclease McrA